MLKSIETLLWYPISIKTVPELKDFLVQINTRKFNIYKLEKDFYLTVILHRISQQVPEINFKWWTCLNKIYFPYFRLSEDLDFSLSIEDESVNTNWKREKFAQSFREKMKELSQTMWWELNDNKFHHKKAKWNELLKNKEYTYLKYVMRYPSIYGIGEQEIKIEVTYTTKQYFKSVHKPIQSIFVDLLFEENIFKEQTIRSFDLQEMTAEKCRACLTRRTPAIRDFFDLRYLQSQWIDILANKEIIKAKCDEVNDMELLLHKQYEELEKQIQTDLLPVVNDLYNFDLKDIYDKMLNLQKELFK